MPQLTEERLVRLSRLDAARIAIELGCSAEDAGRFQAACELGRQIERARCGRAPELRTARAVHAYMVPFIRGLQHETFHVLLLDPGYRLKERMLVSQGTLTAALVHPREVFTAAVRDVAASVIVVHNHPSGNARPSREDLDVTRRLAQAGRILGIPLLDHVIVAQSDFASLRESTDAFAEEGQAW